MPTVTPLPPREVLKLLVSSENLTPEKLPHSAVASVAAAHPKPFETALKKLYYRVMDQQFKKPNRDLVRKASAYFEDLIGKIDTPAFNFFQASLHLTATAMDAGLARSIEPKFIKRGISAVISAFEGKYANPSDCPERLALNVLLGQMHSIIDRDSAAQHFTAVRESDHFDLVANFYWDSGAATYYGSQDLNAADLKVSASEVVDSLRILRATQTDNKTAISVSVDENFFRIYIGWFIFYAQQLPNIDFVITICADSRTAEELITDADDFALSMSRLNQCPVPPNISYLQAPTPEIAVSARTFYACARFFTIPYLLQTYTHVYLVDADLHFESDPSTFMERTQHISFGATANSGLISLPAWRRNMAGNVVVNRTILESSFIDDLLTYMVRGLQQSGSWMLDQNAITYAVEVASEGIAGDLSQFRRPTIASKFMSTWERNYFRAQSSTPN